MSNKLAYKGLYFVIRHNIVREMMFSFQGGREWSRITDIDDGKCENVLQSCLGHLYYLYCDHDDQTDETDETDEKDEKDEKDAIKEKEIVAQKYNKKNESEGREKKKKKKKNRKKKKKVGNNNNNNMKYRINYNYVHFKKLKNLLFKKNVNTIIIKLIISKLYFQFTNNINKVNKNMNKYVKKIEIIPNHFVFSHHIVPDYCSLNLSCEIVSLLLILNQFELIRLIFEKVILKGINTYNIHSKKKRRKKDISYLKQTKHELFEELFGEECLCYAILSNDLELIQYVITQIEILYEDKLIVLTPAEFEIIDVIFGCNIINCAYATGNMAIRKFIRQKYKVYCSSDLEERNNSAIVACFIGNLPVVKEWCNDLYHPSPGFPELIQCSALNGHFGIVKYLYDENGVEYKPEYVNYAALNGHFDIIDWFVNHHSLKGTDDAIDFAARNGHLNIIEYLNDYFHDCTTDAMDNACKYGHFSIVEWLHHHRQEGCGKFAMAHASKYGYLKIIEFLHHYRSEDMIGGIDIAARYGHLNIVEWFHYNRPDGCSTKAMTSAAENGYLDIVEFLHQNRLEGCTKDAMDYAAANGHYNIVEWLHFNRNEGCTSYAMDWAVQEGYFDIVKFLHQNRLEGCTRAAFTNHDSNQSSLIVKYLKKHRPNDLHREPPETSDDEDDVDEDIYIDSDSDSDSDEEDDGAEETEEEDEEGNDGEEGS